MSEPKSTGAPAIRVENLSKVYKLYAGSLPRVIEAVTLGRRQCHEQHWALKDIDFEVAAGDALGIVGSNGAGKSTLLKILTGTTAATSGTYAIDGKVSSLLELGAGFTMEFSGRDNIYMNATILGFTRKQIDAIYDRIVDFSELGPYIHHPLRTYSSGMIVRLGFSIAINVDPDVLILDEVFAVGDAHFQKKCIDRITQFREDRKTILFVSHAIAQVREICDQVLWIRDGQQQMLGEPALVTQEYENYERERQSELRRQYETTMYEHLGRLPGPKLQAARLVGSDGDVVARVKHGDPMALEITYETFDAALPLHLVACILRNDHLLVSVCSTKHEGVTVPNAPGTHTARLELPSQPLLAAAYGISVYAFDDSGLMIHDQMLNVARFAVDPTEWDLGIVEVEHTWNFA